MSDSARCFRDVVWPAVAPELGGGQIIPVEGERGRTAELLDIAAGIDAWQHLAEEQRMRGIASRVQKIEHGRLPYDTFTIRTRRPGGGDTEFQKRLMAIEKLDEGWLLPHLTIQAYATPRWDAMYNAGIVKTADLYPWVQKEMQAGRLRDQENIDHSSWFVAVPWRRLKKAGIEVTEVEDFAVFLTREFG